MHKINISPITRANTVGSVTVMVDGGKIVQAYSEGTVFRGFEMIMEGRDPLDAPYLTQRICGICSSAHGTAACLALEDLAGVRELPRDAVLARNLIFGLDLVQNHIRHFYALMLWDWVKPPDQHPFKGGYTRDFRLAGSVTKDFHRNYWQGIEHARLAHEALTILGGKTPHNHGLIPGGVSCLPRKEALAEVSRKAALLEEFTAEVYLPDALLLAEAYPDYLHIGVRPHNYLSFGMFHRADGFQGYYSNPGVMLGGGSLSVDVSLIEEYQAHSWFKENKEDFHERKNIPQPNSKEAYSWIQAPRYQSRACEGGPLGRRVLGEGLPVGNNSAMERIIARAEEACQVAALLREWAAELNPSGRGYLPVEMPASGRGTGLIDAMRGPLGHWVTVKKGRIANYQIITPSSWNFSPCDDSGNPGPAEEALMGAKVEDHEQPVEIGRIIRSFDPCYACSAHVIDLQQGTKRSVELL